MPALFSAHETLIFPRDICRPTFDLHRPLLVVDLVPQSRSRHLEHQRPQLEWSLHLIVRLPIVSHRRNQLTGHWTERRLNVNRQRRKLRRVSLCRNRNLNPEVGIGLVLSKVAL
jgi:hypothetical protein